MRQEIPHLLGSHQTLSEMLHLSPRFRNVLQDPYPMSTNPPQCFILRHSTRQNTKTLPGLWPDL